MLIEILIQDYHASYHIRVELVDGPLPSGASDREDGIKRVYLLNGRYHCAACDLPIDAGEFCLCDEFALGEEI
jgi:hypothetical protein